MIAGVREEVERGRGRQVTRETYAEAILEEALEGNGCVKGDGDSEGIGERRRLALRGERGDAERGRKRDPHAPAQAEAAGVVEGRGAVVGAGGAGVDLGDALGPELDPDA